MADIIDLAAEKIKKEKEARTEFEQYRLTRTIEMVEQMRELAVANLDNGVWNRQQYEKELEELEELEAKLHC